MAFKAVGADECCCSDCGIKMGIPDCCFCACETICVVVTGPGLGTGTGCPCDVGKVELQWNSADCEYSDTVTCGDLSIDLKFEYKKCGTACNLCLTSTCLGFTGDCATGSECKEFTAGCTSPGECGRFTRGGDQGGGFTLIWTTTGTGCGDAACEDITITVNCSGTIAPGVTTTGTGTECLDCDCVCNCLCIEYQENDPATGTEAECINFKEEACWDAENKSWSVTLDLAANQETDQNSCNRPQSITITQRRSSGGCCGWLLTVTRGKVLEPIKSNELNCPEFAITWDIGFIDGTDIDATLTATCSSCEGCGADIPCCVDFPIPELLILSFSNLDNGTNAGQGCDCLEDLTIELVFDPANGKQWTSCCPRPDDGRIPQFCSTGEATQGIWVKLTCDDEDPLSWTLQFDPCNVFDTIPTRPAPTASGEVIDCDPFMLVFPEANMEDCCTQTPEGLELITITISE